MLLFSLVLPLPCVWPPLSLQICCLLCGNESNKRDAIMDVCLDVHNLASVHDALRRFTHPELLEGDNQYRCERCGQLSDARKALSIFHAPNVLVIQLKVGPTWWEEGYVGPLFSLGGISCGIPHQRHSQ